MPLISCWRKTSMRPVDLRMAARPTTGQGLTGVPRRGNAAGVALHLISLRLMSQACRLAGRRGERAGKPPGMDAAFGLAEAAPAAVARIATGGRATGAGDAADRGESQGFQGVPR